MPVIKGHLLADSYVLWTAMEVAEISEEIISGAKSVILEEKKFLFW